jgi:hypothetical protein
MWCPLPQQHQQATPQQYSTPKEQQNVPKQQQHVPNFVGTCEITK